MPETRKQFIVCAALRNNQTGRIITGPRHYDEIMRSQIARDGDNWHGVYTDGDGLVFNIVTQGFVDQYGNF